MKATQRITGDIVIADRWLVFIRPEGAGVGPCGNSLAAANQRVRLALTEKDSFFTQESLLDFPSDKVHIEGEEVEGHWVTPTNCQFEFRSLFGVTDSPKGIYQPNNYLCCGCIAYVFIEILAEKETVATLGLGADSWLQAWVNGDLVLDHLEKDMPFPPTIDGCLINAPFKQGRNVLALRYVSGSASSILAVGGPRELNRKNFKSILTDPLLYGDARWNAVGLRATPGDKVVVNIGRRRELFVDDYMIDAMTGSAQLRLHHPNPQEVVYRFDQPWEGNYNGCFQPCSIVEDDGRVLLYYKGANHMGPMDASELAYKERDLSRNQVCCLAISSDGVHFSRPQLGVVDHDGSSSNNIVWDGCHYFTPFLDTNPNAPACERFKAISGHPKGGLGSYVSADGVHWSMLCDDPVITIGAFDSQNLAFWDPVREVYVEYHRGNEPSGPRCGVRGIMTSTSKDFIHWTEPACITYMDDRAEQMYTNCIRPYPRAPHIHIGTPARFVPYRKKLPEHMDYGISDAILMSSRDMGVFHRWEEAFIRPNTDRENWTDRNCYPAWGMVQRSEGEISLYWCEHNGFPSLQLRRGTIRTDGFVSLHSGAEVGEMLSRPFMFKGNRLEVNYATSAIGTIRIELCDLAGNPSDGFSMADSDPIFGSEIAYTVSWNSREDLSCLAGQPLRLRVRLQDADLYSFAMIHSGNADLIGPDSDNDNLAGI